MKHFTNIVAVSLAVTLMLVGCAPVTAPPAPSAADSVMPATPADDWQTFTDSAAGFSISTPPSWSRQALPDQADGAIHGEAFAGTEGGVEVYWGTGFGGACPSGTVPVEVAGTELPACYTANADGTESWSQIGYQVAGGNSFSVNAHTSNAAPSSHDLVLQVLATLSFMPSAPAEGV